MNTMTFAQFRELARNYICYRGYRNPIITDGWNDGGSDLRVYQTTGLSPQNIAIQVSVQEKNWKAKLKQDARQALTDLNCGVFLYVTNRRLPDAEYQPVADELLQQHGISCSKADGDSVAQYVIDDGKIEWVLDLLGIDLQGNRLHRSLRQEVADAFMLFSSDAEDYRQAFMEHALTIAASQDKRTSRDEIVVAAAEALGIEGNAIVDRLSRVFDSLLTRGVLVKTEAGGFEPSEKDTQRLQDAYMLRDAEWVQLVTEIGQILRKHCPSAVSNADIDSNSKNLATQLGTVVRTYRDYQRRIIEDQISDDTLRLDCAKKAGEVESMLRAFGVAQNAVDECVRDLCELQEGNPIVSLLEAGETFRQLTNGSRQGLLTALGQTNGAVVILDTSVLIPLLCGQMHGAVCDQGVTSALHLLQDAGQHGCPIVVPSVYIEEAAAHLIMAGRFVPVVHSSERGELDCSENAFVSYFARSSLASDRYRQYLSGFGHRGDGFEFYSHRDSIMSSLTGLLRRYHIMKENIDARQLSIDAKRDADTALGNIYHHLGEERPEILFGHDSNVLAWMKTRGDADSKAFLYATWDRCMQQGCQGIHELVLGVDPVNAAELLELSSERGRSPLDIQLIMHLSDKEFSLASRIWDVIIEVEKEDVSDADLLPKARSFKADFLARQQSDATRTNQIVGAWRQWKSAAGDGGKA
ncbi:MAG: hypothetical protein JJU36_07440 [Phycisphaeraceae bacterium]|nr:hypothetical protein [Phycisphaeraceae bacterium]